MIRLAATTIALTFALFAGCGPPSSDTQSTASSPAPASTNPPPSMGQALEQYGHTMATAKQQTMTRTDLIVVDRAVQSFQADRGRNPESLDELIKEGFLPRLPELPRGKKYSYDPQSAKVTVVDAN